MIEDPEKLAALRKKLEDDIAEADFLGEHMKTDVRLNRFLQGYKGDVEKAALAFREMIKWRKEDSIDEIFPSLVDIELRQSKFPHAEEINKSSGNNGPWYNAGRSHQGHVIHIEILGSGDPSAMIAEVEEEKIMTHHKAYLESKAMKLDSLSMEHGKMIKTLDIRDLSLFGVHVLRHSNAMNVLGKLLKIGSANYPESCQSAFMVNTPTSFYAVWSVVKTFLRQETVEKVQFLDGSYHRQLLKLVPVQVIHKLEYLRHSGGVDGKHHDEFDPLEPLDFERQIRAPAGSIAELFIYMTRSRRNKCRVRFSDCDPFPTASVLTSKKEFRESPFEIGDDSDPNVSGYSHEVTISYPENCEADECLIAIKVDNSASWVQAQVVDFQVSFSDCK